MEYVYIGIGGFLGAVIRYLIYYYFLRDYHTTFPYVTFFINIVGSFLLSFISNLTLEEFKIDIKIRLAITTGFIGAFTTFSTFIKETIDLMNTGEFEVALLYVLSSIIVGFIMSFTGFELADKIEVYLKGREEN